MAAMNKEGGFVEFVEKPQKALPSKCPECQLVLREPYQAECCGYVLCRVCAMKLTKKSQCPSCNKKKFKKFEDKSLKRVLYGLRVYCTNKQQGCQWEGELGQLDNHLNINQSTQDWTKECQFTKLRCYYCSDCFKRSDIQIHQINQCPGRPFSCQYCKDFNSNYGDVTKYHWSVCGYYPLPCLNKCGEILQRQNLQSHIIKDCPLTIIDCDFQHVGCEERLPRKDMSAHLQEGVVRHLSLQAASYKQVVRRLEEENKALKQQMVTSLKLEEFKKQVLTRLDDRNEKLKQDIVSRLEEENDNLRQQVVKLTKDLQVQKICTPTCPVELTMTNFEQKLKDKELWRSPPFYTHLQGYKMTLNVYAHGDGKCKGTHASTFIGLMKGEFDDQLKWPFRGKFEIELLVQSQDKGHYKKAVNFGGVDDGEAGKRVTEGEICKVDCGMYNFISHGELRPMYLNSNNCLKFRINSI